ncbi:BRO-N domain-containing protein, partial [Bacillus stratosphericus]
MNELQKVFNYQEQQVRTVVKDGEPWFVAKDVC